MQGSRFVAAVLSVVMVGGAAYAVAQGGNDKGVTREAICDSRHLTMPDQDSCRTQMKAASTEVAKQQVATRFQSKIDAREAQLNAGSSSSTSSSGGVSTAPSAATPNANVNDAASGSLNQPDSTVSNNPAPKTTMKSQPGAADMKK